jgi:EmrB/QacA subfamily drug resistance transporter
MMGDVMNSRGTRKWWALGALALSMLAVGLDLTVLNVALPTLATDLHASTSELQWFASGYTLVLAAALLPAGTLGDRFGRRRFLIIALIVFGIASLGCAYAPDSGTLIAARALLGLAAAFLMPLTMSVLPVLFTEAERPRAIAIWATSTMLGIPLGPIVGGWLLDNFWWGSAFLINVPMVLIALVAVLLLLPESRGSVQSGLDWIGVLSSSVGLLGITYGVIEAGQDGWGSADALVPLVIGAVVLAVFVGWQHRMGTRALVDLSLFRSPSFTWGTTLATLVNFAMVGLMFAMPQYFQAIEHTDALGNGLRLLPMIGGMLIGVRIAGPVATRAGAKVTATVGYLVMALALGVGATTGLGSGYGFVAAWFAVFGLGLGFAMPTAMNAAMSPLSAQRSGIGSAVMSALRQTGAAIGVAILGTVLSSGYQDQLRLTGVPAQAADAVRSGVTGGVAIADRLGSAPLLANVRGAFVHGLDLTLWVSAGLALVGALVAITLLPARSGTMSGTEAEPEPHVEAEREVVG